MFLNYQLSVENYNLTYLWQVNMARDIKKEVNDAANDIDDSIK